jgi:hypothetical protein
MNDLRILFADQPPFFQAVAVVLAALGLILLIGVVEGAVLSAATWIRRFRARRYFDRVVRIERQDRRRRELNAVSRSGGRS